MATQRPLVRPRSLVNDLVWNPTSKRLNPHKIAEARQTGVRATIGIGRLVSFWYPA
jgi:hypothetical protein